MCIRDRWGTAPRSRRAVPHTCTSQACAEEPTAPAQGAPPAEVHAAYQCGLLSEAAAREFNKGAAALRKTADAALLADFGEQVGRAATSRT
eukprot:2699343-Prymnesium_polylepis.1